MEELIKKQIKESINELIELRRYFHMYPEVGFDVINTTNKICEELDKLNIKYTKTGNVGVIVDIKGTLKESDDIVMIRSDMDALAQIEKTNLPFKSKNEGLMHACGHDVHMAMLLGACKILNQNKDKFKGTARLIFQPAEEIGMGAKYMIEHHCLDGVKMGMALHVDPLEKVGIIKTKPGPTWAAVDRFTIKIEGESAHGAMPHKGKDALITTSAIALNLQTFVSRECDPTKPIVITIGKMSAGSAYNIIAQNGYLEGTVRCFDEDIYQSIPGVLERIATNTAKTFNCNANVEIQRLSKPLVNNLEAYNTFKKSTLEIISEENFLEPKLEMVGEDFAEYGKYIPCVIASIGADGKVPLHNSCLEINEDVIELGILTEVNFVFKTLNSLNESI